MRCQCIFIVSWQDSYKFLPCELSEFLQALGESTFCCVATMLSSMLKEHQKKQLEKKEEIERKREETLAASNEFTSSLINHLNEGVAKAYLNERKLDAESKQLQASVSQFSKQATQWLTILDSLNKSVKELGDVQNWAKSIENDMRLISSALEYAYKVGPQTKN